MEGFSAVSREAAPVINWLSNCIGLNEVTLVDASSNIFVVDNQVSLSANEKEQVLTEPLIMKESEALKVQASSGQTDVIASILEINREDR